MVALWYGIRRHESFSLQPTDDESLASLKIQDLSTITLADCFKSFVREDNLGDDELWYVGEGRRKGLDPHLCRGRGAVIIIFKPVPFP